MRIVVIGGGIGGLTAAIALRRAGFDAHVYEQLRELREIGAGVNLGPNTVRALRGLGFEQQLDGIGIVPEWQVRHHWQTGEVLGRAHLADTYVEKYGQPSCLVHRAELHEMLRHALGDKHVTLNARCVRVEQKPGQPAIAYFADGATASGDLLIGADGSGSAVRDFVTGPNSPIGPSKLAWRGLAPGEIGQQLDLGMALHSFTGKGKFFLAYYVSKGRYVNWVGIMNPKPGEDLREAARFEMGDQEGALADYAGWAEPVQTLIKATNPVLKWLIFDGEALTVWTRGHVTLLGDAAHPMLPFAGQGAGQAVEDAVILARILARTPHDLEAALAAYEGMRRERATAVQSRGRANGAVSMNIDAVQTPEARPDQDWVFTYDALNAPLPV